MTNINNITSKIIAKAEAKRDEIIGSAQAEKETILGTYQVKAEQEAKIVVEKATANALEQKERLVSRAHLNVRDNILQEKQERINQVFTGALEQLRAMDEATFGKLVKGVATNADFTGDIALILGENTPLSNPESFVTEVNKDLNGKKLVLSEEKRTGLEGFILEQNRIELNCSFAAFINNVKEDVETEVAAKLFS